MAGIFEAVSQQMPDDGVIIIEAEEHLKAFQKKKSKYRKDKQKMITSLIFLCWKIV